MGRPVNWPEEAWHEDYFPAPPTKTPTPRLTPTRTATRTTDTPPGHARPATSQPGLPVPAGARSFIEFIERHGLVRYARGLGARYPREGPCEVGICRAYDIEAEAWRLVFDHCHAHGWVRGLVCVPCNNRLMHIETGLRPQSPEWQGFA